MHRKDDMNFMSMNFIHINDEEFAQFAYGRLSKSTQMEFWDVAKERKSNSRATQKKRKM